MSNGQDIPNRRNQRYTSQGGAPVGVPNEQSGNSKNQQPNHDGLNHNMLVIIKEIIESKVDGKKCNTQDRTHPIHFLNMVQTIFGFEQDPAYKVEREIINNR